MRLKILDFGEKDMKQLYVGKSLKRFITLVGILLLGMLF